MGGPPPLKKPGIGHPTYNGQPWTGGAAAAAKAAPKDPGVAINQSAFGKSFLTSVQDALTPDVPQDVADAINSAAPLTATNKRMAASRGRAGSLLGDPAPALPTTKPKSLLGGG